MFAMIAIVVRFLIGNRIAKLIAAEVIEALVESTSNKIDDKIARPILQELRR